jgi:stage II sporulation protein D
VKLGRLLLLSLLPALAAAQTPDVAVRIYHYSPPAEVRLVPAGSIRLILCATCKPQAAAETIAVRAEGDRLVLSERLGSANAVRVSGAYRLEVAGHARIAAAYPLAIAAEQGRLLLTLRIPLEEYVAEVMAVEASGSASDETLKAMAVAVRSYAAHYRGRHRGHGFDFCDSTHCQATRLGIVPARLRAAVAATQGELLVFDGKPAAAYYHRNCGGVTEAVRRAWPGAPAVPYLQQHDDAYCPAWPHSRWSAGISGRDLAEALRKAGIVAPEPIHEVIVLSRTPSGRASRVAVGGSGQIIVGAEAFRLAISRALGPRVVRSDLYEVRVAGDRFVFYGRGAGHGVGLCQVGAAEMGRQGKSYAEILAYYYPGTRLGRADTATPR